MYLLYSPPFTLVYEHIKENVKLHLIYVTVFLYRRLRCHFLLFAFPTYVKSHYASVSRTI